MVYMRVYPGCVGREAYIHHGTPGIVGRAYTPGYTHHGRLVHTWVYLPWEASTHLVYHLYIHLCTHPGYTTLYIHLLHTLDIPPWLYPGIPQVCTIPGYTSGVHHTRVYLRVYSSHGYTSGCIPPMGVPLRCVTYPACTSQVCHIPSMYLRVYIPWVYLRVYIPWVYLRVRDINEARPIGILWEERHQ